MNEYTNIPAKTRELINNLNQQVRDLQNRNMELDHELSDVIEESTAEIGDLRGKIALLQEANRELKGEVTVLKNELTTHYTVQDAYDTNIDKLDRKVQELQRMMEDM